MTKERQMSTPEADPRQKYDGTADFLEYRKNRDEQVFRRIVEQLGPLLYGYLQQYLGNATTAQDVMQQTWTNVIEKRDSFQEDKSFKAWLFATARHLAIDEFRHKVKRPTVSKDGEDPVMENILENPNLSPINRMMRTERDHIILTMFDRLSPAFREVLRLYYWDGMIYKDIAQELHINVGTVRSRIHKAKLAFRNLLEGRDIAA